MTKVLLIEDDAWLADIERAVLKAEGYSVRHVTNGQAAMDSIDVFRPDVIILDVLLDGHTAFTLLHELRSYKDTSSVPVVLCTNLAETFPAKTLDEYGVKRVVDKTTMHPSDIVGAIRAVL
ncbi:TPA: hypothetical protein DD425_01850 [Candidatus Saccharibacteria bacterium]|nr:hypothetical protein [Candidatus Saccharibacteria bacterium]|tara:strand:- start:181 stop:543 length:363 start_codon:yes stop_codon:yes gene_type:complete